MIDTVVSVKLPIGEMLRIKRNRLMPDVVINAHNLFIQQNF